MLIEGPTGVGKTSLLRSLDPTSTLFVDIESGDLAVSDVSVDTLRPRTCRNVATWPSIWLAQIPLCCPTRFTAQINTPPLFMRSVM
jgi:ABC-type phosphate/phosphonate transport system ATPase subunit